MSESRAINRYIATKYQDQGTDLLRHDDPKEAALVNVWVEVEGQNYNPPISALVFEIVFKPLYGQTPDEEAIAANAGKLEKVLDVYEERLSKSKYLAGDSFTLADLHHLPYTYYFMNTAKASLINSRPHVKAWWEDISSRPAFKKVAAGMGR